MGLLDGLSLSSSVPVLPPKSVLVISGNLVDARLMFIAEQSRAEDKAEQKDMFHLFLFIVAFIAIILS